MTFICPKPELFMKTFLKHEKVIPYQLPDNEKACLCTLKVGCEIFFIAYRAFSTPLGYFQTIFWWSFLFRVAAFFGKQLLGNEIEASLIRNNCVIAQEKANWLFGYVCLLRKISNSINVWKKDFFFTVHYILAG